MIAAHADRFQKRAFPGPYPEPHTTKDGRKLPPDGMAQPATAQEQSGVGLSYPAGCDFGAWTQYLGECPRMWNLDSHGIPFSAGSVHPHTGMLLYALALNARPTVVVETGTFFGYSTWWLAQAMCEWGEGMVYTVDPDMRHVPPAVSEHPHVTMIQGHGYKVLPRLMTELGEVHFAFLDSYKRMALMEFDDIRAHVVPGGMVVFHDTQAFSTGHNLWLYLRRLDGWDSMLLAGTPAVDDPHHYFGNADDRGLFLLRRREADPFLHVADHGTHSEALGSKLFTR